MVAGLILVGVVARRLADQLSAEALGMAIGVLFGMLAGIPTTLLIVAAGRKI